MSILLTLDSSQLNGQVSDNFTISFTTAIDLGNSPWEVALVSANLWYSFHNISSEFNNNTLRYSTNGGVSWVNVTIPNGAYQVEQLDEELKRQMRANGHFDNSDPNNPRYYINLVPNFATLRLRVELSNNYQLDLSSGNLHLLLGFTQIIVTSTQEGANPVNITRDINTLLIRSDIVSQSFNNSIGSDILWTFIPNTLPGASIQIEPSQRIYVPIRQSSQITSVRMYVTDQLSRRINFNGENVTYRLHLRKMKSV